MGAPGSRSPCRRHRDVLLPRQRTDRSGAGFSRSTGQIPRAAARYQTRQELTPRSMAVRRLAPERLLKLRHIADHPVHAELIDRMGIRLRLHPLHFFASRCRTRSDPMPRKKRCASVNPSLAGSVLPAKSFISAIHASRSPPLSAVFSPERQFAVHVNAAGQFKRRVLLHDALRPLVESFGVRRSPPVFQVAFRIELPALIVEAVRQFVARSPRRSRRSSSHRPPAYRRTAAAEYRPGN